MHALYNLGTTKNTTWIIWFGSCTSTYICLFSLTALPPIGPTKVTSFIGSDGHSCSIFAT